MFCIGSCWKDAIQCSLTEDTEASLWDDIIYRIGEHFALFYGFPITVAAAVSSSSCKPRGKGIVSSELMLALIVSVEAFLFYFKEINPPGE